MDGGYVLKYFPTYYYCCLFIYTLPPSKVSKPASNRQHLYIDKIKCLFDYHITMWLNTNVEPDFIKFREYFWSGLS